jgi:2-oxo-4-hydroxy-4-carboxy--5-ureidoimidazoline (OHCU) decarboxylase
MQVEAVVLHMAQVLPVSHWVAHQSVEMDTMVQLLQMAQLIAVAVAVAVEKLLHQVLVVLV